MLDQLSPAAPARVRVVLLPIGQIKRSRFLSFVERLEPENVVRLGDVSPDGRPNRNMFSPLAFQMGMIVYDLTTFYPPPSHVALSPFELYREPLVILALADGTELGHMSYRGNRRSLNGNGSAPPRLEHNVRELYQDLEDLRDRYPKALVHQVLLFDHVQGKAATPLPEGVVGVPPPQDCRRTTMKTIMCDISSMLLAEMTHLAKSMQALNTIDSPSASQMSRQSIGASWPSPQVADMASRRNSQYSLPAGSRSESPAGSVDRSHVRMSMPVFPRQDSNSSSPSGRPTTPMNGGRSDSPAATVEDIVSSNANGDTRNPQRGPPPRFNPIDPVRDKSRDRVSVTGFGSGSVSERSRNKGKGRVGVVIGSMYLVAGRWQDALKELIEAANIAKNNLDHLWHAKALDNILVAMIMLAWTGLDFDIPQICYVSAEKAALTAATSETKSPANNRLVSLQNLTTLLPELLDRILNLYARAANNTGESLPQYPFSESVIRFCKLLSAIHLAGGSLNDDVLSLIVVGTSFTTPPNLMTPRLYIRPTRTDIVTTVFRAFPNSSSENVLPVVDRTIILSGIASVLGTMGYNRKKAMVVRELVGYLIPGLVQARKKGAAEMGVHPAAGLAALNSVNGSTNGAGVLDLGEGDMEIGVDSFLGSLGQSYGVVSSASSSPHDDSDEAVIARIVENASTRAFGGLTLKMDVLRSCINISEALPDFHGVLRFTADLLRTAGSGVAPGPRSQEASPSMSREEQVRLSTNISRTLSAARNLGVKDLEAEYWDEFLLRGVEVEPLQPSRMPIPHTKKELPGAVEVAASRTVNPFIYNPFLRMPDIAAADHLLVAGEGAIFKVTLQNPFEFDVEIESLRLESEGADFDSAIQKTVIGPYRTQILTIVGTPKGSGQLKMTGCIIRVRGCRERRFPIFEAPWSSQRQTKVKYIGVASLLQPKDRPISVGSGPVSAMLQPKPVSVGLNVIDKQPVVIVKSTSLSQSALMVLEGESQVFSITLQNISKDTPVDLLLFSFKDSTQGPLQAILSNRESPPAETYECELILARKQALRWKRKDGESPFIAPGGTAIFEVEVLGKPGLTSAVVQIDYAHLGVPAAEVQEKFHTRQVSLPLTITVNASVELVRIDILPLPGSVPKSLWSSTALPENDATLNRSDYCLLLLDLRNAWPSPLKINLSTPTSNVTESILPGNTSRLLFPIPRIHLTNPSASIPSLDPSRQRQFVVSTSRISADTERAAREAFWYREEVLNTLTGSWSTTSGPSRSGGIELRSIRLSPRMIEAVRIEDIDVDLSLSSSDSKSSSAILSADTFTTLFVKVTNRTAQPIFPLLRLQPSLRHQSQSLDISKRLILDGLLQQSLPLLFAGEESEIKIGLCALGRGEYEISGSIEEARLFDPEDSNETKKVGASEGENERDATGKEWTGAGRRQRANTSSLMDSLLGVRERRIWHAREPLVLRVIDDDDEEDGEEDE